MMLDLISGEQLSTKRPEPKDSPVFPAMVQEVRDTAGAFADVILAVGSQTLLARITRRSVRSLAIAPGIELYAQIKSVAVR